MIVELTGLQLDFIFRICAEHSIDNSYRKLTINDFTDDYDGYVDVVEMPQLFMDNIPKMLFKVKSGYPRTDGDWFEAVLTIKINNKASKFYTTLCLAEGYENYKYPKTYELKIK